MLKIGWCMTLFSKHSFRRQLLWVCWGRLWQLVLNQCSNNEQIQKLILQLISISTTNYIIISYQNIYYLLIDLYFPHHLICWPGTSDNSFKHEERYSLDLFKHKDRSSLDIFLLDMIVVHLKGLVYKSDIDLLLCMCVLDLLFFVIVDFMFIQMIVTSYPFSYL